MSLEIFNGANIAKSVQANDLIVIENAVITVKNLSGDIVDLFEDKEGTVPLINPFTADDSGSFVFFVAQGEYNLTVSKNGVSGEIFIELGASGQVTSVDIETNALSIDAVNHGTLYNVSDITGLVNVTVGSVTAEAVGSIVFLRSDTNSPVVLIEDVGVTIETPYSFELYARYSTIALMAVGLDKWSAMGNFKP